MADNRELSYNSLFSAKTYSDLEKGIKSQDYSVITKRLEDVHQALVAEIGIGYSHMISRNSINEGTLGSVSDISSFASVLGVKLKIGENNGETVRISETTIGSSRHIEDPIEIQSILVGSPSHFDILVPSSTVGNL